MGPFRDLLLLSLLLCLGLWVAEAHEVRCATCGARAPSEDDVERFEAEEVEAMDVQLLQLRLGASLGSSGSARATTEAEGLREPAGFAALELMPSKPEGRAKDNDDAEEGVCWADADCCPEDAAECDFYCQEGSEISTGKVQGWEVKGQCVQKWEGFCTEDEQCGTGYICQRSVGMLAGTCTRDTPCETMSCGRGRCRWGSCTCDFGVSGERCDRSTEAFAFLFYGNSSDNLVSVRVLVRSLRSAGAPQDILAIIPTNYADITPPDFLRILEEDGVKLFWTEPIPMPPSMDADPIIHKRWSGVMNKFAVWRLLNYSQVALLDTDMVFDMDSDSPQNIFAECNAPLCAVRDGDSRFMNAGVMVVIPSRQRLAHVLHVLHNEQHHFAMPEQSFLTRYCENPDNKMRLQFLDRKWNSCVGGGMLHNTGWESTGYNVLHSCSWTGKPPNMRMCFPGACDSNDEWHTVLVWQFFHLQADPCIRHAEETECTAAGIKSCTWCGHYCSSARIPCSKALFNESRVRDEEEPDSKQLESLWGQSRRGAAKAAMQNATATWNRLPQGSWAWPQVAMYQILIDRFATTAEKPCTKLDDYCGGSLGGIKAKLEYIQSLGVDGVVLSPIVEQMPHGYHGYWTKDLNAVNPQYGDEDDVKELVALLHERRMKVVVDVNLNHAGSPKVNASDPRDLAQLKPFDKPEYYHSDNCTLMHNADYERGSQFLERCKLYGLPDYNHENPVVWQTLMHWVREHVDKYGFDGIRVDAAHHISRNFLAHIPDIGPPIPAFFEVVTGDMPTLIGYSTGDYNAVYNYPLYFLLREIFVSRAPMSKLSDWMQKEDSTAAGRLLLNFLDNNDLPRFTFKLAESGKVKDETIQALYHNALLCILGMEGLPVLLYGSEQAVRGEVNMSDVLKVDNWRPALWQSTGYNTSGATFQLIRKVLWLRRRLGGLHEHRQVPLYSDHQVVVFARGTVIFVVSNAGQPSRIPSQRVLWANATQPYFQPFVVCNLLAVNPRSDCGVIAPGNISRLHLTGDPKVYVPTKLVEEYEAVTKAEMDQSHVRELVKELEPRVLPFAEWPQMPNPPTVEIQALKRTSRARRPGDVAVGADTQMWHAFPALPPHLDRWSPPVGVPAGRLIETSVEDACFYLGAGEKEGAIFARRGNTTFVLCPESPEQCPKVIDHNINVQRLRHFAEKVEIPADGVPLLHLTYGSVGGTFGTFAGTLPSLVPFLPELRSGAMKVLVHMDREIALPVLRRLGVEAAAVFPTAEPPLAETFVACAPRVDFALTVQPVDPRFGMVPQYLRDFRRALWTDTALAAPAGGKSARIVLLTRGNTSAGVARSNRLVAALRSLGRSVEALDTEAAGFEATLEAMQHAEVVVGLRGGHMASVVFAPEGTKVVEIVPQAVGHLGDGFLRDLAGALNQTYAAVAARSPANERAIELDPSAEARATAVGSPEAGAPLEVDEERLKALVAALL